jgi:hypothetical protein
VKHVFILAVLFVLGSFAQALAVERERATNSGPTNNCQSALPVFDGNIRKRPRAVVNEGDSSVFVTCSFDLPDTVTGVRIFTSNQGVAEAQVSCTGVNGFDDDSGIFVVKTVQVPTSGPATPLFWQAADFGSPTIPDSLFSISCHIPPDVGLRTSQVFSREDIGE